LTHKFGGTLLLFVFDSLLLLLYIVGGIEKKVKEKLAYRCLEVDTFGYLVEHLEGEEWLDF